MSTKLSVFKVVHVILIHNKSDICQKGINRNSDTFPLLLYVNYIQFGGELHLELYIVIIIKFTYNEIGRCSKLVQCICVRVVKNTGKKNPQRLKPEMRYKRIIIHLLLTHCFALLLHLQTTLPAFKMNRLLSPSIRYNE